jgi:YfiH family protein
MKSYTHDDLLAFRFDSLPNGDGPIHHAVFSRLGGVSLAPFDSLNMSLAVADERDRVYANRRRAYGLFGRDTDTVVHAHLVHGATVARVTTAENGTWVHHVDGLITDQPGCVLTMSFADCAPILLYDPVRRAIGLGHAGWKGTVADLPGALVRAMGEQFGSDPADLLAAVGPCIGPCCYEVGDIVIDAVRAAFAEPDELLKRPPTTDHRSPTTDRRQTLDDDRVHNHLTASGGRPSAIGGHFHFDLPEANRRNLLNAGVRHVELAEHCTACRTDLFFSHRAEKGRTGRFGVVLGL